MADNIKKQSLEFRRVKNIHFVGIGGVGMSGIAEVLAHEGYVITGSDLGENIFTERLKEQGVTVHKGHRRQYVNDADVVVTSTAIPADNVEVVSAREKSIPIISRAEMLAELMRFRIGIAIAGTHGKTTTTSLVAGIMMEAGLDPTYVIGGKLNSLGANSYLGSGKYLVAEADESDSSFLHLQPVISVVTNIDEDHMDTYQHDVKALKQTFVSFLHRLPFYGLAVLCCDDEGVQDIIPQISRPMITYGFNKRADIRAVNLKQQGTVTSFDVLRREQSDFSVQLNLGGEHNVLNALAAIGIATDLAIPVNIIVKALSQFGGVGRRFQSLGDYYFKGGKALFIDDYGHHPRELAAVIKTAKTSWPNHRIVMIFQPHRYTRTRDLFNDFVTVLSQVDVLLLLEVYAAGEAPLPGINSANLHDCIVKKKMNQSFYVKDNALLPQMLDDVLKDGDIVLIQGAGSVSNIGRQIIGSGASFR